MTALCVAALAGPAAAAVAPGPRSVAVVWFDFAGGPSSTWTAEQIRSAVFAPANSANAFMREQSFDRISLTGQVFGKYTINVSSSPCNPDAWQAAARSAAGASIAGYQHQMFVFPRTAACGWAGLADVVGDTSFINGTLSTSVISHELGHNFGSQHASAYSCVEGSVRVVVSRSCTASEYGDPFDVMGSSSRHTSAVNKVRLGFVSAANEVTASRSGRYPLVSSSRPGVGTQSLRIRQGTTNNYWYFELRSPAGQFDNFLATDPAANGVSVRFSNGAAVPGSKTYLIDTRPATGTFADAPLPVGQTFVDASTPGAPNVTVDSLDPSGASLRIEFPGDPLPPPGTPPPSSTPPPPVVKPVVTRARVLVRRISRTRGVVRVTFPAGATTDCASRIASRGWKRCTVTKGLTTATRGFTVRRSTVAVALRLDETITLDRRFGIPRPGAKPRLATLPLRVIG